VKYQRDILKNVEGYVPGEQPKMANIIKLNTNENPYPPSPKAVEALLAVGADSIRRYPDPLATELRRLCAERYGYENETWVFAGNGVDECLANAMRAFVDPGDTVITPYPTYVLYETLAQLHGATCKYIDLDNDFQLTEQFFTTPARMCFLPRPNSPSGVVCPKETVERLCREFNGLVVIDEAYIDFGEDDCMDLPKRFDNAMVMRTFSKSFSLAGMRLGITVARPEIINEFMKVKDSYNLDAVTQAVGTASIQDYDWMLANAQKVKATRARLVTALEQMGFKVPPSQANFILAQWMGTTSALNIFKALRERAIIVRYFDMPRLQDKLRITVGTDSEVDALIAALEEIVG